jgi:uncharacterized protein (TIGR02147 family)
MRTQTSAKLNIRSFTDYRAFLLHYAKQAKARNRRWSLGSWAKTLGLSDATSISKILKGQRKPGPEITRKLVEYFQLSAEDATHFQDLITLDRFKRDAKLSSLILKKIERTTGEGPIRTLDLQTFEIISNWYCLAVREMVRLDEFMEDPDWIAKRLRFKVTPSQTLQAIRLLVSVGLLVRDASGALKVSDVSYKTTYDLQSLAIQRFHSAMLDNAKSAISSVSVEDWEFFALILSMRCSNLFQAKEFIREFSEKFEKLLEEDGADDVFQMQVQFFPLTGQSKTAEIPAVPSEETA